MKKITLLFALLLVGLFVNAQTTHNLDWYMGINTADASLTIDAGDTVIWTFTDASSHSVTSDTGSTEAFDSGIITAGSTYSYTFTAAGTNPYHCDVHPSMIGTITVNAAPASCLDPTAVTSSNITINSTDLDWTENGTATLWDIEIGPQGFTPTGTPTHDNVSKPYTISGLTALTIYDVYLRSDCGSSTSAWVGPTTFSTACGIFPSPFLEDFETSTTNLPGCWQSTSSTTREWDFDDSPSSSNTYDDHTTGTGYFAYVDGSSTTTPDATLTMPPVDVSTLTTPMLEFYVHHFDNNSNQATYDDNTITVEVFDGTAWQQIYVDSTADVDGWQLVQINLTTYVSAGPMLVRFVVKTDLDTNYYNDIAIDDISFKEAPSCFQPLALTATNITENAADLGWTDGNTPPATTWDVEVVTAGTASTGTPTDVGVTANPYTKTGLTANTDYEFYVRSDCGATDGASAWSGPFAFTTPCPTTYIPAYSEDFTESVAPDCWTEAGSGTPATGPSGTTGGWLQDEFLNVSGSSNQAARINLAAASDEEWLISPAFDLSGGSYELAYMAALTDASNSNPPEQNGMGSDDEVQVLISTDGGTTWTNLKTYNQSGFPSHTGDLEVIDLSAYSGTATIAFWANEGSVNDPESSDFFIDDFHVRTLSNCAQPTDLIATLITNSSADFAWTENGTAAAWDIEMVLAGTPPTGTPTDAGVTSNPYNKTGLTANTDYEFYVRADCGSGDTSYWAGPYTFTTDCNSAVAPYTMDFETSMTNTPDCWTVSSSTTNGWEFDDSPSSSNTYDDHTTGTGYFAFTDASSTYTPDATMTSLLVDISALTTPILEFYVYHYNSNTSSTSLSNSLIVEVYDGAAWNQVYSDANGDVQAWEKVQIDLTTLTITGDIQVRFIVDATVGSNFYNDIGIDDISIKEAPSCFSPNALTATNILATSADLGWTESGTATTWDIEVVTAGTTPAGTPTDIGVTSNPYNVTGLTPQTDYEFYVRADCGGGDLSTWSGPFAFTTPCAVVTPPYLQDFTTFVPDCWEEADGGDATTGPTTYGTGDWTFEDFLNTGTNQSANINIYNAGDQSWLFSPTIDLSGGVYELTYMVGVTDYNNSNPETMGSDDVAEVLITTDGGVTWVVLETYNQANSPSATGTLEIVDLSTYTGIVQIAFWVTNGAVDGPEDYDFFIDDFDVHPKPSCSQPTALTATNILATSADLGWTESGTATTWSIELVTAGTTPTGTPTDVGVTSNPYNVTGLTANTSYEFYVRADCGGTNGLSPWSGPFAFYTGYCISVPTSNDNNGIAAVVVGTTNYTGSDVTYLDFTATPAGLNQSVLANVQITFETGYTYDTHIWVDFNDDLVFDSTEMVFTGASTNTNPTTLDASFMMPSTAPLGQHRMRIGTADNGQSTPNPCYSGTYGVTVDFTVDVLAAPSCLPPTALAATNIAATSADLGWTERGSATIWDIELVAAGTVPTGIPTSTGVSNPFTLTGLSSCTNYEFYVRADCGVGDISTWSGPFLFSTAAGPVGSFVENFDTTAPSSIPNCWTTLINSTSTFATVTVEDDSGEAYSGTNYLEFYDSSGDIGDYFAITPQLTALSAGTHQMRFYAKSDATASIEVGTMTDPTDATTFTVVQTITLTTSYTEYIVPFFTITTDQYIAFKGVFTATYDYIEMDDVNWESPCLAPTALVASNITDITADIAWTAGGSETEWEVEYGSSGFTQGSGTIVADNDGTLGVTLTGLSCGTYDVYVRSVCGMATSAWSGLFTFNTVATDPSNITVGNITANVADILWTAGGNESEWEVEYGLTGFTQGTGTTVLDNDGTLGVTLTGLSCETYDVYVRSVCGTATSAWIGPNTFSTTVSDPSNIAIGNITSNTADISWTAGGSETEWEIELGLTGFMQGAGTIIPAATLNMTLVGLSCETYDVYVRAVCGTNASAWTGPVTFSTIVPDPSNITISNIANNTADVSWTPGGSETEWEIEYGPSPLAQGTGMFVLDDDNVLGETISGLISSETYDVYVRAICGPATSNWVGPHTFNTLGITDVLFENFSYYPNPVKGRLSLKTTREIQEVVLYDLLGQVVFESRPNSLSPILDLRNLQSGTYLMEVTIDSSMEVYKVIKE